MISTKPSNKVLSVFSLVMINIIAVDSLRNLPISAEYGFSIIFYYILGALLFFIPIALVAAELATGWPKLGGMYVWVKEAFGPKAGLVTIWLQWIYNIVWYPTILAFLATTAAYFFNPALGNSKVYLLTTVIVSFWLATFANCFGMRLSSWISTAGALLGTIIPMVFIIILGAVWLLTGHTSQIQFTTHSFFPDLSSINNLSFLIAVLFGLIGMEMSAVHAEDVKNPSRDYPKALLWSALLILGSLGLASLAISVVIPKSQINLVSGLIDAFGLFFKTFHMSWMIPVITVLIIIGGVSGVSTWVIGPTRGLLAAAQDGSLPPVLCQTNKHNAPVNLLIVQATIFTILCSLFLLMPTIASSYWLLSALTAQLALIVYLFMFAAAIKLRYSQPNIPRAFRVPGGNWAMWLVAGAGFMTCIAAIAIGFIPPPNMNVGNLWFYEGFLIMGIVGFCLTPLWLYRKAKLQVS